ncbi:IS200/IS605 family element transposase accessory protein TnpB [Candidatus Micrarchaeota archaeon]|nr:IS200/IS605 family element transposase accessory protein TnpB [Candidatus Micrarchaeota archaeon]
MQLLKTLKIKIGKLSTSKSALLLKEYSEFQKAVNFSDEFIDKNKIYSLKQLTKLLYSEGKLKKIANLYSATYQTAYTQVLNVKRRNKNSKIKKIPLTLRHDTFKFYRTRNKLFKYFIRIPVFGLRGGILLPLYMRDFQEKDLENCIISDSKISYSNGNFFLHLTIKKEVEDKKIPIQKEKIALISIDLGERNPAVSVARVGSSMTPRFYRENIRAVRAHYRVLRQELGKKKLLKKIKQMKDKESRITKNINHRISKAIVEEAKQLKAKGFQPVISMGDLQNIRKASANKGRNMKRRINQWSYYQLQQFVTYKANWDGIPVCFISERGTSKTCHTCGNEGIRKRGLFTCSNCSMEYNADLNGAINISTRSLDYMFKDRASMTMPHVQNYKF